MIARERMSDFLAAFYHTYYLCESLTVINDKQFLTYQRENFGIKLLVPGIKLIFLKIPVTSFTAQTPKPKQK